MNNKKLIELNTKISEDKKTMLTVSVLTLIISGVISFSNPLLLIGFVPSYAIIVVTSILKYKNNNKSLKELCITRKELSAMKKSGELDCIAKQIEEQNEITLDNENIDNTISELIEEQSHNTQSQDTLIQKSISRTNIYLNRHKNTDTATHPEEQKPVEKKGSISRTSIYLNQPKNEVVQHDEQDISKEI